jgi:hypothetical protein
VAEDRLNLPFIGPVSFLRGRVCTDLDRLEADIAILAVPSDEGSPLIGAGGEYGLSTPAVTSDREEESC